MIGAEISYATLKTYFIRVLYKHVFPLGHFHAEVSNCANYTPAVRKRYIELRREINWAHGRRREYHMARAIARIETRYVAVNRIHVRHFNVHLCNKLQHNDIPNFK